jgi:hypothetical protein
LRQRRDAFLADAAAIETRIGTARDRQHELRAILVDDTDVLDQATAQAEFDALEKIVAREHERLNGLHDRAASLAPQIADREQERARLIGQRAKHIASLARKAELEQRLRPIADQLVALVPDIRFTFPETAGFVREAGMLIGKVPGEQDHLRQVIDEIDRALVRIGE